MFGRGKERQAQTMVAGEYLQGTKDILGPAPKLPEAVSIIFKESIAAIEEYKELQETIRNYSLPRGQKEAYQNRLRALDFEIKGAANLMEGLRRGYEYHPIPDKYFAGLVDENDRNRDRWDNPNGTNDVQLVFGAPMPLPILHKYETAKRSGLFKDFVVISPDREAFRQVASMRIDPVLIGVIRTNIEYGVSSDTRWDRENSGREIVLPGLQITGGVPLRIAHWDLGRDLTFAPQSTRSSR